MLSMYFRPFVRIGQLTGIIIRYRFPEGHFYFSSGIWVKSIDAFMFFFLWSSSGTYLSAFNLHSPIAIQKPSLIFVIRFLHYT